MGYWRTCFSSPFLYTHTSHRFCNFSPCSPPKHTNKRKTLHVLVKIPLLLPCSKHGITTWNSFVSNLPNNRLGVIYSPRGFLVGFGIHAVFFRNFYVEISLYIMNFVVSLNVTFSFPEGVLSRAWLWLFYKPMGWLRFPPGLFQMKELAREGWSTAESCTKCCVVFLASDFSFFLCAQVWGRVQSVDFFLPLFVHNSSIYTHALLFTPIRKTREFRHLGLLVWEGVSKTPTREPQGRFVHSSFKPHISSLTHVRAGEGLLEWRKLHTLPHISSLSLLYQAEGRSLFMFSFYGTSHIWWVRLYV